MNKYQTPQEQFWAGEFGEDYIKRNKGAKLLASNLNFFVNALNQMDSIDSCLEFGANIGMNLKALKLLFPNIELKGIEINTIAADELAQNIGSENVFNESIFDYKTNTKSDLVLIKGVLIHINPEMLKVVYEKLYDSSTKFILIAEYYNPSPIKITYRGHDDKLFKRDFAGEIMDLYKDLTLIDYGFCYSRDKKFPLDDINWFLLEKRLA